ncbi:MAG: hypothetical protein ABIJ34_03595 [archaeon]
MKRIILFLIMFCILSVHAQGLGITGQSMKIMIDHVPGYTREDTFYITNNEGYTSTYTITPTNEKGSVPPDTLMVIPPRLENVKNGETRSFVVKVALPEEIPTVGQNEVWVQARIDSSASGAIKAYPSVAIRYIIFVLYPYKFPRFEFSAPSLNINETQNMIISINNLGKPTIGVAKAYIDVYDLETNELVRKLESSPAIDIASRETKQLTAAFDSYGLKAGNYRANATVLWDQNSSLLQSDFRIGTKNVKIVDFPTKFEYGAINRMDISVESAWNTKINEIQATVTVIDIQTQKTVKTFKSFQTNLLPWESKSLESYFDTSGLEKKDYLARIVLIYEGSQSSIEHEITIDENINAAVVEEIPGTFSLKTLLGLITPMNILIFLIILFLIINMILIYSVLKRKQKKDILVDEAVVNKVIALISQYKDEYIKELLIKKGWHAEEVKIIMQEAKKRAK